MYRTEQWDYKASIYTKLHCLNNSNLLFQSILHRHSDLIICGWLHPTNKEDLTQNDEVDSLVKWRQHRNHTYSCSNWFFCILMDSHIIYSLSMWELGMDKKHIMCDKKINLNRNLCDFIRYATFCSYHFVWFLAYNKVLQIFQFSRF